MKKDVIQPEGNYYDKYGSKNPIEKKLISGFFAAFDTMLDVSGIAVWGGRSSKQVAVKET